MCQPHFWYGDRPPGRRVKRSVFAPTDIDGTVHQGHRNQCRESCRARRIIIIIVVVVFLVRWSPAVGCLVAVNGACWTKRECRVLRQSCYLYHTYDSIYNSVFVISLSGPHDAVGRIYIAKFYANSSGQAINTCIYIYNTRTYIHISIHIMFDLRTIRSHNPNVIRIWQRRATWWPMRSMPINDVLAARTAAWAAGWWWCAARWGGLKAWF